ncbi:uncharacterized protein BCR38DRAFT_196208 [Pseudomassariella vexata]|uniref:Uncharacterized protein n=1 Tax=Pseudomassariella vexata TaxID=1141098 RepID=A0A1Y2E1F3_9PEZI|nr:uncharacterized protein BCR38DRAFT_196208 [Pseudomassariella vexata]ORY65373.1 hypothetical protein BCR38DRAFT_196208 [Pseudomassariella vexata]
MLQGYNCLKFPAPHTYRRQHNSSTATPPQSACAPNIKYSFKQLCVTRKIPTIVSDLLRVFHPEVTNARSVLISLQDGNVYPGSVASTQDNLGR